MKNPKLRKALVLACSAILLVCISIGATVAYLTSTDAVTNTFTVGNVKITLDEAPVYDFGEENIPEGAEPGDAKTGPRVKTNEYHLLPGHEYDKDPTVHVAEKSDDCWVFVKIENGIAGIEDKAAYTRANGTAASGTIAEQIKAFDWTELTGVDGVDGVYYKEHAYSTSPTDYVVFKNFKITNTINNNGTENINDGGIEDYANASVKVTAYAIQKDGFDTAAAAWAAGSKTKAEGGWAETATEEP